MSKHTRTVSCDRCNGVGILWETIVEDSVTAQRSHSCPSCLGQTHVDVDIPVTSPIADILLGVLQNVPYADRKTLEREIADTLFKGEVDEAHRAALEQVVDRIQQLNAEGLP